MGDVRTGQFAKAVSQNADIGFVLGGGFVGIDLDKCIAKDGTLTDAAQDLVSLQTYVELSPSEEGLHTIICGTIPESHKYPGLGILPNRPSGSARWFTFTGNHVGDVQEVAFGEEAQARLDAYYSRWFAQKPAPKLEAPKTYSDDEVIELLRSYKNGSKFQELWDGGNGKSASDSEADLAFLRMARFLRATGRRLTACSVSRAACERNGTNRAAPSPGAKSASPKRLPWAARSTIPEQAQNLSGTKKCGFRFGGRYESEAMARL